MASSTDLDCVEILIRAPSQRVDDFSLTCDLAWTVSKIKSYLAAHYPTHPDTDEQKLIYRGQLMRDHVQLKDIIASNDEGHREIFHLVCQRSAGSVTPPVESGNANKEDSTRSDLPHPDQEPQPSVTDFGVRFRGADQQFSSYSSNNGMYNTWQWHTQQANVPQNNMYTYYWQMYASHMAAAAAAAAAATHSRQTYVTAYPLTPPTTPASSQPSQGIPAAGNAGNADVQPRQPAGAAPAANAQGDLFGAGDDDDDDDQAPRDWLDRLYMIVRFGFMLTIFFFYCTPTRFIMLIVFSAVAMLYQGGFLRLQRARAVRAYPRPRQAQGEDQNASEDSAEDTSATPAAEAAQPSVLGMVFGNILAFFTSLIPAGVPHVAPN